MFGFYVTCLMVMHIYTVEAQMKFLGNFKRKKDDVQ